MATVNFFSVPWAFDQGLPPGTEYYGYFSWNAPPHPALTSTSVITAVATGNGDKLTMVNTSIRFIPGHSSLEFTIRNTGPNTVRHWTVNLTMIGA